MDNDFTKSIEDKFWEIGEFDETEESVELALQYLNNPNNFYTFSQGLTHLILKYGYTKDVNSVDLKTEYLFSKLLSIGVSISKSTIKDWFTDKRRPALVSNSRAIMFQICFSLKSSFDDTKWFFHHVYFDRSFNCHTIEEAVYYYCIKNNLSYAHSQELIETINTYPIYPINKTQKNDDEYENVNVFTDEIRNYIDNCTNDNEFLSFFKDNKAVFGSWNKTALKYIKILMDMIRGKNSDKDFIASCKLGKKYNKDEIKDCGLIIQEYLLKSSSVNRLDTYPIYPIKGKDITSIDFMLERMITTNSGISTNYNIPEIVRKNFPNKKTFSNILKNAENYTSYDSIRKCLILLEFYRFWITLFIDPTLIPSSDRFDSYVAETNDLLSVCSYESIFSGNPYDWIFLWASKSDKPIEALRSMIY